MSDQQFSIQQNVFEICTANREKAHELQNRVSRLVNDRLTEKMNAYFSRIIPEDRLLTIDRLSYDIGTVDWDELEEEIEERFMQALDDDLSARLQLLKTATGPVNGIHSSAVLTGKSGLLEYFLFTGTMPWWSRSFESAELEDILDDLYHNDRSNLQEMVLRSGKNQQVRKRMINQFTEKGIRQIISAVAPAEAEYIFDSHKQIVSIQEERQLVKTERAEFNRAVWLFILNYLMAEQSGHFNRKMFIRSNLAQLAATYNIAYQDVLHIFYDALESGEGKKGFITLQKFIKEIAADEAVFINSGHAAAIDKKAGKKNAMMPSPGIKVLDYFLHSDSLPYEFEQLSDKELAGFLLDAVMQYPKEAKAVFIHRAMGSGSGTRLYRLLGAAGTRKLYTSLFPAEEMPVSEIIGVLQALQGISPFIHLSAAELNLELWRFIFDARVTSGNSPLSEENIIAGAVSGLEREYNIKGMATWNLLQLSLENSSGSSIQRQPAFKKIGQVVRDKIKQPGKPGDDILLHDRLPRMDEEASPAAADGKKLKDVLRYILQYGSVPWWGGSFYHLPVADMLLSLYSADRPAYVLLFRQAMQSPQMKKRLFDNMPAETLDELLDELPNGKTAVVYVKEFSVLLQHTKLVQYYDTGFIQKSLLALAAEILAGTGYHLFSGAVFYKEAVIRLSSFLQIKREEFILKMITAAIENTGVELSKASLTALSMTEQLFIPAQLAETVSMQWQQLLHSNRMGLDQMPAAVSVDDRQLLLHKLMPGDSSTEERITFFKDTLHYFLTWNRLPDKLASISATERPLLLQELVSFLFGTDKAALETMLAKPSVSDTARSYITELFAGNRAGEGTGLFTWLVKIGPAATTNGEEAIPAGFVFTEAAGSRQHAAIDLQEFFTADVAMPEPMPRPLIYKRSLALLEYFLRYNKLPGDIPAQGKWRTDLLLKEVAVFLFENDAGTFKNLLDMEDISVEAKLRLYDLFATGSDIVTGKIAGLVDEKRESEVMQFLISAGVIADTAGSNDMNKLVDDLLHDQGKKGPADNMAWLLSSASFAKLVLERAGLPALLKLAAQKLYRSPGAGYITQAWYYLIQNGVTSSFSRAQVLELFKRFNTGVVSGAAGITGDAEYSNAFLQYLAQNMNGAAHEVYAMLFDFIDARASGTDHLNIKEIKALLLLLKAKLQQNSELEFIRQQHALELRSHENKYEHTGNDNKEQQPVKLPEEKATALKEEELLKENKNGFYIRNAGIVLFHPFLETFFNRTGLMEKGAFIDNAARYRGVLLLQYLANEKTEHEEHELVLNKILCNVPLTEPLPVRFTPTDVEKAVCKELFDVVIQRWPKMKNATPGGLRTSLILRNGVVKRAEDEWNMRVEQKGYDVILQTLPWAFGFIKAKWMDKPLTTEWI